MNDQVAEGSRAQNKRGNALNPPCSLGQELLLSLAIQLNRSR